MAGERIELGRGTWDSALREETRESVNVGNISDDRLQADVFADTQADLDAYKTELDNLGYDPSVVSILTDPVPDPEPPPPTADEITAREERVTAFNSVMVDETDQFWADVEAAYDLIKTTGETFTRDTDAKRFRQRMR